MARKERMALLQFATISTRRRAAPRCSVSPAQFGTMPSVITPKSHSACLLLPDPENDAMPVTIYHNPH